MVVGDIASLKEGEAKLSLIMNEDGNIMDDTVITNAGDHIYMVVNGACKVRSYYCQCLLLLLILIIINTTIYLLLSIY